MPKPKVDSLPHSWLVSDWPAGVSSNSKSAARELVRAYRKELIECGALTRVGRNLTVLGEGYAIFLARKMKSVAGYKFPARRSTNGSYSKPQSGGSLESPLDLAKQDNAVNGSDTERATQENQWQPLATPKASATESVSTNRHLRAGKLWISSVVGSTSRIPILIESIHL